jgi:polysaccharide biosynthesis protein PslH
MKILMICPYTPYPLTDGGKVRVFNLIKRLSKNNAITLVCHSKDGQEESGIKELLKYCKKVLSVRRRRKLSLLNVFIYLFTFYPMMYVMNGFSRRMTNIIKKEIDSGNYDLVQVEHYYGAEPMLSALNKTDKRPKTLLIEHNIEYSVYESYFKYSGNIFQKLLTLVDVWRIWRTETQTWRKFDSAVFVCKEDGEIYKKRTQQKDPFILPNGVDVDFYSRGVASGVLPPSLVFLGNFKYVANVDAVKYFIDKVWPFIKASLPDTEVNIIGNDPEHRVKKFVQKGVKAHGYIKDVRTYLNGNNVFVSPLRVGGGIKLKVLEAMAAGMTVVGTSASFYGMEVKNGTNCIIEDESHKFAEKIVQLLRNNEIKGNIGKAAAALMKTHYDWDILAKDMQNIYNSVINKGSI